MHDTVLDSDGSLTLPVWFTRDDIVDLFSSVCLIVTRLHVLLSLFFHFLFLSFLYFVYDLINK